MGNRRKCGKLCGKSVENLLQRGMGPALGRLAGERRGAGRLAGERRGAGRLAGEWCGVGRLTGE